MLKYLVSFLMGGLISLGLTPLLIKASILTNGIDHPNSRKIHKKPIPRLGGIGIFVAFNAVLLIASKWSFMGLPAGYLESIHFGYLFLGSMIVFGIGLFDDFKPLPPSIKFLFQIGGAGIVAIGCCRVEVIITPFGVIQLSFWGIPFVILWIVGVTNAINLLDGLDGLASGTSIIICIAFFGISVINQNSGIALISMILAGSIAGFLKYNFHPANIFLGNSGAYYLGFMLGVLALLNTVKKTASLAVVIPILILMLPLMDTFLAMFRRMLRSFHIVEYDQEKNDFKFLFIDRWSVFRADKGHIHHQLLKLGLNQKKAVLILYVVSIFFGGVALVSVLFNNPNNGFLLIVLGIAAYGGIRKLEYGELHFVNNGTLLHIIDSPIITQRFLRPFVDLGLMFAAYYLAFMLRFEGVLDDSLKAYFGKTLPLVLLVKMLFFIIFALYKRSWRYTGIADFVRILKAVITGSIATIMIVWAIPSIGIISRAVLIIDMVLLFGLAAGARSVFPILEYLKKTKYKEGKKVLIYGIGRNGINAYRELSENKRFDLTPVGFIDDDPRNIGKYIAGCPVLGSWSGLEKVLEKNSISEVIIAKDNLDKEILNTMKEICRTCRIRLRRFTRQFEEMLEEDHSP